MFVNPNGIPALNLSDWVDRLDYNTGDILHQIFDPMYSTSLVFVCLCWDRLPSRNYWLQQNLANCTMVQAPPWWVLQFITKDLNVPQYKLIETQQNSNTFIKNMVLQYNPWWHTCMQPLNIWVRLFFGRLWVRHFENILRADFSPDELFPREIWWKWASILKLIILCA